MHATQPRGAGNAAARCNVQKPLTRTVLGSKAVAGAANKYRVATQMATRATPTKNAAGRRDDLGWRDRQGTEVHAWTDRPTGRRTTKSSLAEPFRQRSTGICGSASRKNGLHVRRSRLQISARSATFISLPTGVAFTIRGAAHWATWHATFWCAESGVAPGLLQPAGVHSQGGSKHFMFPRSR